MSDAIAVSLASLHTSLQSSYRRTYYKCSTVIAQDGAKLSSYYCGYRWCLVCGRIRTAKAIDTYLPIVSSWQSPHMVTLTIPNVAGDVLRSTLETMLDRFNSCVLSIRRTAGLVFRGVRKLEITYNPRRDDYHPHYHVLVEGQAQATALRSAWLKRFPDASGDAQDVRPADDDTLVEMFKYFTKLTTKAENKRGLAITAPRNLDTIFRAMEGKRVWQPVGFTIPHDDDVLVESSELDVAATPAVKRLHERIMWTWDRDASDWLDCETGETLSDYTPSPEIVELVETIPNVSELPPVEGPERAEDFGKFLVRHETTPTPYPGPGRLHGDGATATLAVATEECYIRYGDHERRCDPGTSPSWLESESRERSEAPGAVCVGYDP